MRRGTLATLAALLAACNGGANLTNDPHTEGTPIPLVVPDEVIGIANIDDDLEEGGSDWWKKNPDDEDHATLVITPSQNIPGLTTLRLTLDDPLDSTRVYHDGQPILDDDDLEAELDWHPEDFELKVEFSDFNQEASLTVVELDADGNTIEEKEVLLRTGPLILTHHLQPSEFVSTVDVPVSTWGNQALVEGYMDAIGDMYLAVDVADYQFDVWLQDEIELGYQTAPGDLRLDVVVDSIRDRGLDDYAEDVLKGPDVAVRTWGEGYANSLDSFGNLEIVPPFEGYPFGRIYYGGASSYGPMATELFEFFADQGLQDPFMLDTTWLCVGHVDEYMAFVPDPNAPRGFRLIYTDTNLAWEILEGMDPNTPLPQYAGGDSHGIGSVQAMLNDTHLRNLNDDLQAMYLDTQLDVLRDEIGLLEDEIVLIPGLFEEACGPYVAALQPGMANLFVVNDGPTTKIFLADPFMREDVTDQSTDPFIQAVQDVMPPEVELHFLDDWETYHMALGEVHCGTNGIRTPIANWWETETEGGN